MKRSLLFLFNTLLCISGVFDGELSAQPQKNASQVNPPRITVPQFVFVSRALVKNTSDPAPVKYILPGVGGKHRFTLAAPGKLQLYRSKDDVATLIDGSKPTSASLSIIDVSDPCVSWDGKRVVFAGIQHKDSAWRIFEIGIDGKGLHRVTNTDRPISREELVASFGVKGAALFSRYDDTDPCYLPDGRICFSSTRYPQIATTGKSRVTNLYAVNTDGSDLYRITSERNGADEATIDPFSGRVIYSRWWVNPNLPSDKTANKLTRNKKEAIDAPEDFYLTNFWQAVQINPNGSELALYTATSNDRKQSYVYEPFIMKDYSLLGVTHDDGSLALTSAMPKMRFYKRMTSSPYSIHLRDTLEKKAGAKSPLKKFATNPIELPDGRILFSFANTLDQDFGIYVCNPDGTNLQQVLDIPKRTELDVDLAIARPVPPVYKSAAISHPSELPPTEDPSTWMKNGMFSFHPLNIYFNGPVDFRTTHAPPVGSVAAIRFYINPQRKKLDGSDAPLLLREEKIGPSGEFRVKGLPADVPMFEQLLDEKGNVVRWDQGVAHVTGFNFGKPREMAECAGCHPGHSAVPLPDEEFFVNIATAARAHASSSLTEKDLKCIPAHLRDREARTHDLSTAWIASGAANEWAAFGWDEPMEIRAFTFFAPFGSDAQTLERAQSVLMKFYEGGREVRSDTLRRTINESGTRFRLKKSVVADSVIFHIDGAKTFAGKPRVGLAEIEVDGRLARAMDAEAMMKKK